MKKCPACTFDLTQRAYEGFRILQCGQCFGHLVPVQRFEAIKRLEGKSLDELKDEVDSSLHEDCASHVKCPRCYRRMDKQTVDLPLVDFQTDLWRTWQLVWLDGGELALVQLAYQIRNNFIDAQELKRRMNELEATPDRKAQFEQNLANLPKAQNPLVEALEEECHRLLESFGSRWH